ncbi:MAG TPA: hypothetical protein VMV84_06485 [Dehalococcoidales bacterium]|nr:hypothetical protein [Dehalococcoidales bacterium]
MVELHYPKFMFKRTVSITAYNGTVLQLGIQKPDVKVTTTRLIERRVEYQILFIACFKRKCRTSFWF